MFHNSLFQIDVNAFCSFSARSARLSAGKGAWEEHVEAPVNALISLYHIWLDRFYEGRMPCFGSSWP